ncbi:MAG TPA: hypothetical protein VE975_01355, partial [Actinomycetota bacterium]|nr:hypothetical protein [Actinomycetota bacterium]
MEITAVSERALRTGSARRVLWIAFALTLIAGLFCWGFGAYVAATWLFIVAAAAVALVLPQAYALVSPLFMGVVGWLVDMLPLVILVGWLAVVLRWMAHLLLERRRPRGGRWVWLPLFLVFWTALGAVAVTADGIKHFVLLLGVQVLISATLLLIVDSLSGPEARAQVVAALLAYVCVLSGGVFLEWVGVPVQALQDSTARLVLESAYGLDAFPNSMGMIKFTRSSRTGLEDLRSTIEAIANRNAGFPAYIAFKPRYHAYQNYNVIRFEGSARRYESVLERHQIHLIFDNVALAPANTVPRMRSFPRNALTYAGACAA